MTTTHTLAVGRTLPNKYAALGASAAGHNIQLAKRMGLIVGEPGCGKSFIAQSHPDAFILNLDISPTVCPTAGATMFPVPNADGQPTDENGSPFVLDWSRVNDKLKLLHQMAVDGKPRPQTVFIDTLGSLIRLLRPHVAKELQRPTFRDAHGPMAWEFLYDLLISMATDLRRHGYGVFFIGHMTKAFIPLGDNVNVESYKLQISDGLYQRLFQMFDVVIPVATTIESQEIVDKVESKMPNGTLIKRDVPRIVRTRRHFAQFSNPKLEGLCKSRTLRPMDIVNLSAGHAWEDLEKAFADAMVPE